MRIIPEYTVFVFAKSVDYTPLINMRNTMKPPKLATRRKTTLILNCKYGDVFCAVAHRGPRRKTNTLCFPTIIRSRKRASTSLYLLFVVVRSFFDLEWLGSRPTAIIATALFGA
jgi:hypothetical protein